MFIDQLHPSFYHIKDVFSEQQLTELRSLYWDKHTWRQLYDDWKNSRHEKSLEYHIDGLEEIQNFIEDRLKGPVYANWPQLWFDYPGYINRLHKDMSPNIHVNAQIYLIDSKNKQQGTYFIDDVTERGKRSIYGIDYAVNTGYIMFGPTQFLHGMKYPVTDHRMSLYQSYRLNSIATNEW